MITRLLKFVNEAHGRSGTLPTAAARPLAICACLLMVIGIAARLSPLLDADGRLFWQYMTEDGYLMQTIARNMAIGLGMSTAEGTMHTNGVQPLATFLFAAMHYLAAGSKFSGILLVTVFSALSAAAAAFLFQKVSLRIFAGLQLARELAWIAAGLWLAAPLIIRRSMNGLETGVYYVAILFTLHYYLTITSNGDRPASWPQRCTLGAVLGFTFLARNDAVFFIGGLLLAHVALGGKRAGGGFRHRFWDGTIAGIVSLIVASPWLIYNRLNFGSIVPISGTAQSHSATLGQNLAFIPANLFENAFLYAPIPRSLETMAPVIAAILAILCIVALVAWPLIAKSTLGTKRFFLAGAIFGLGITVYYGLFFGAAHFIPRYVSPLSIFLWPATLTATYVLLNSVLTSTTVLQRVIPSGAAILVIAASGAAWSDFSGGRSNAHKQVVSWVAENVPERQWVGAVQTGTLGYFHDRTINLDGKVNPDALREILQKNHIFDYVLASKINYIVDWQGIAAWIEDGRHPQFAREFAVVVHDKRLNLAALRRIQPVKEN